MLTSLQKYALAFGVIIILSHDMILRHRFNVFFYCLKLNNSNFA